MSQVVTLSAEEPHTVQFYENHPGLVDPLCGLIAVSLEERRQVILLATSSRRQDIEKSLAARGDGIHAARGLHQYLDLDAAHFLSGILVGSLPDRARFNALINGLMSRIPAECRGVRVFDETVALLWMQGLREGALQLETMWGEVARAYGFLLHCAYPPRGLPGHALERRLGETGGPLCQPMPAARAIHTLDASMNLPCLLDRLRRETTPRTEREKGAQNTPGGRYWMGLDGRILWANRIELNLLGYEPEEYIGRHISEFHAEPEAVADILQRLRSSMVLYDYPARLLRKNGSVMFTSMYSTGIWKWREVTYICCLTWTERDPVS